MPKSKKLKNNFDFQLLTPVCDASFHLKYLKILFVLIVCVFLLTACGSAGKSGTTSGKVENFDRDKTQQAMILAQKLAQRGSSLKTLAVRGSAVYSNKNKRNFFRFEAAVIKPNKIFLTAFDPTGRPAFKLASNGKILSVIAYGSKEFGSGVASHNNFSRFIPLDMGPEELIDLLGGFQLYPMLASAKQAGSMTELTVVPKGGDPDGRIAWRMRLKGSLDQNPDTAMVESATFGPPRNPELSIRYMSRKATPREDINGVVEKFPYSLDIQWREKDKRALKLNFDEVRLGPALGTDMMNLKQPEGFEFVSLD